MRILFDQGTPVPLRKALTNHEVTTAYERGWSELKNGELLNAAEEEGFDVFVTTDSNLKYQQNLQSRRIAIIVLTTTSWPRIRQAIETVVLAVDGASEGMYVEVAIPR
jgi:predicted nuclease of predicted toxin-antitoxin system